MLYLYKNVTPNKDNLNFYYFKDFSKYQTFLSTYLVKTVNNDKYTINSETLKLIIDNSLTQAILDEITYIVDIEGNYKRCYFVNSFNYQSGFALFGLSIDLWASYIFKASFNNCRLIEYDRKIPQGSSNFIPFTYKDYNATYTHESVTLTSLYSNISNDDITVLFSVKFNVYQSNDGSVSIIKMFGINLRSLKQAWTNAGNDATKKLRLSKYQDLEVVERVISGIYGCAYQSGQAGNFKAEVINAWIIPFYIYTSNAMYFASRTGDSDNSNFFFTGFEVQPTDDLTPFVWQGSIINTNKLNYFGTKYNGLKLYNSDDMRLEIRCTINTDNINIIAVQGDNEKDLTPNFTLTLTNITGDVTPQRQIATALNKILTAVGGSVASLAGIVAGIATYNPLAVMGGLVAGGKTIESLINQDLRKVIGSQIATGSALVSFEKYQQFGNDYIENCKKPLGFPFYIRSYDMVLSNSNIEDNLACYNSLTYNLNNLITNSLLYNKVSRINTALPNSTDTYIKAKCEVTGVSIDACIYIQNVFEDGVLLHILN